MLGAGSDSLNMRIGALARKSARRASRTLYSVVSTKLPLRLVPTQRPSQLSDCEALFIGCGFKGDAFDRSRDAAFQYAMMRNGTIIRADSCYPSILGTSPSKLCIIMRECFTILRHKKGSSFNPFSRISSSHFLRSSSVMPGA